MRLRSLFLSLVLLSVFVGDSALWGANQARAEARLVISQPRSEHPFELNIHGATYYGFGWYDGISGNGGHWGPYAVGPGVQMLFPIVKNAIPSLNNPMYLGFFTDILFIPAYADGFTHTAFSLAIGPVFQWRFNILELFESGGLAAFANVGFGLWPWFNVGYFCNCSALFYGFPLFELGGQLQFTRRIGMTLSFGYPSTKLGVNLAF